MKRKYNFHGTVMDHHDAHNRWCEQGIIRHTERSIWGVERSLEPHNELKVGIWRSHTLATLFHIRINLSTCLLPQPSYRLLNHFKRQR